MSKCCFFMSILVSMLVLGGLSSAYGDENKQTIPPESTVNFLGILPAMNDPRAKACFEEGVALLTPLKDEQKKWQIVSLEAKYNEAEATIKQKDDTAKISWGHGFGRFAVQGCIVTKEKNGKTLFYKEGSTSAHEINPDFFKAHSK